MTTIFTNKCKRDHRRLPEELMAMMVEENMTPKMCTYPPSFHWFLMYLDTSILKIDSRDFVTLLQVAPYYIH